MESEDQNHDDCDTYYAGWFYYDEECTDRKNRAGMCLGISYFIFLFWNQKFIAGRFYRDERRRKISSLREKLVNGS